MGDRQRTRIGRLCEDWRQARFDAREKNIRWLAEDEEEPQPSLQEVFAEFVAIRTIRSSDILNFRD